MRILCIKTDNTAIAYYRLVQPLTVLSGPSGVHFNLIPHVPAHPEKGNLGLLYEMVFQYDLVILQRCYDSTYAKLVRHACDLAGIPMVYETDDDYFHVPESNNAFGIINEPKIIGTYHEILEMADAITTTTLELANVIRQYNDNVHVLPNNILYMSGGEHLDPTRDYSMEKADALGSVMIPQANGSILFPSHFDNKGKLGRIVRIGYTATESHREDVETIASSMNKILDKYGHKVFFITIGDEVCHKKLTEGRKRTFNIQATTNYSLYYEHLRNIDIGIAPLIPNLFNMSKSQIKAVEYGSWGTPAVLPNMVTYAREFTHMKDCLLYNNKQEFYKAMEVLINDHDFRDRLGAAARDRVRDHRHEQSKKNWGPRLELYKSLIGKYSYKPRTKGNTNEERTEASIK